MDIGVYEQYRPSLGILAWGPRLQQIAQGGFSVVLNYGLLYGYISDVEAYIDYAYSLGIRTIVPLSDPAIWKTASYATTYPLLYASIGGGSGLAFAQGIMQRLNVLPGVYGFYVGDEVAASDASIWQPYSDGLLSYANGLPRIAVASSSSSGDAFYTGTSVALGHCEIGGDDYYPIGDDQLHFPTMKQVASGIQATCNAEGIKSCIVLQAFSWAQFSPPQRSALMPFPALWQMTRHKADALANMVPALILYWNYAYAVQSPEFWAAVCMAANGVQGGWI
jgi:hypothetical protein